jgi:hypothetical protein
VGGLRSIQATPKRGHKSVSADLQAKTLRKAYRNGQAWTDEEVSLVVNGIDKDETTYEMALSLGRTYYSVASTRTHVRFALNHAVALYGPIKKRSQK